MALLTTPESAATERICESFQSTTSSGTVGRQLAGEKAHGKTCLISLGLDHLENHQERQNY